eukprot:TRINITY_DN4255_c0_g1_i1.p1 TRINITY_DN4255_c0_g1~~TRINITY_DN4255_c0_g1_i1.p1  ORF type:complete len:1042 (-),score=333.17 TRINITY_DN4255_c0_g1_i1:233-3358(-)
MEGIDGDRRTFVSISLESDDDDVLVSESDPNGRQMHDVDDVSGRDSDGDDSSEQVPAPEPRRQVQTAVAKPAPAKAERPRRNRAVVNYAEPKLNDIFLVVSDDEPSPSVRRRGATRQAKVKNVGSRRNGAGNDFLIADRPKRNRAAVNYAEQGPMLSSDDESDSDGRGGTSDSETDADASTSESDNEEELDGDAGSGRPDEASDADDNDGGDRRLRRRPKPPPKRNVLSRRNDLILQDSVASQKLQRHFVLKHRALFTPFVDEDRFLRKLRTDDEELAAIDAEAAVPESAALTQQPDYLKNGNLWDYQMIGINWLIRQHDNGVPAILADEMGLGKTIQTITLLTYLKNERNIGGPHLVVAPLSVCSNWVKEAAHWETGLKVVLFYGNKLQREALKANEMKHGRFDICVTNYESLKSETSTFQKFVWRYLILDEGHRIKNAKADISAVTRRIRSQHKLLLTGTPVQNNLNELWALLGFMFPTVFEDSSYFDKCFDPTLGVLRASAIQEVTKLLKLLMLRRIKADVEIKLPTKTEIKIYVPLTDLQTQCYKSVLLNNMQLLQRAGSDVDIRAKDVSQLMSLLMQLRKVCMHPYLFDIEPEPFVPGEHLVRNSGKMMLLDKLLPKLKKAGSRVLLYSQFTRMLDILEDFLNFRGYGNVRLDGSTHQVERDFNIKRFASDQSLFVFLISTRAGGLGINLNSADTVILFDSDWNPHVDLQAQARCHRIGQTRPVTIYRLVAEATVEERIVQRAERKMLLDAMVMSRNLVADDDDDEAESLDVLATVKFGAQKIFNSRGRDITDDDLDAILSRSEAKAKELRESDQLHEDTELDLSMASQLMDEELLPLRKFQGQHHEREDKDKDVPVILDGKRSRKKARFDEATPYTDGMKAPEPKPPRQVETVCFACRKADRPGAVDLNTCSSCPRVYHDRCLGDFSHQATKIGWHCPHHVCSGCQRGTNACGGYMFRCNGCPRAFCGECFALEPSFETIGKASVEGYSSANIMWIRCSLCASRQKQPSGTIKSQKPLPSRRETSNKENICVVLD